MDCRLYPRPVPNNRPAGDRLQIWIGVFDVTDSPPLQWTVNGTPAQPTIVVPLGSVRPPRLVPNDRQRAFTGIYEFAGLLPDTVYTFTADVGGERVSIDARTLPNELPVGLDQAFHVLLVSCYYQPEDRSELVSAIVRQLTGRIRPHLTFLLGDQVYLDLPTLTDFKDDTAWLADWFEGYYVRNWRGPGGLTAVLSSAPCVSLPDDHEYWNNAPHFSPIVGNTRTVQGRENWRAAAETVYRGFQLPVPLRFGDPFVLDVPPLSFFLVDSRSRRLEDRSQTMTTEAMRALRAWCERLVQDRLFGVFAAGQSLQDIPKGELAGSVADYALSNYEDFPEMVRALLSVPNRGQPLLCLTGDVHWGRVTQCMDVSLGRNALYEVIVSPSALVSSVGVDQFKKIGDFFSGLFGERDPWPRHASPETAPDFLAHQVLEKRYQSSGLHGQMGDHVALLSFTRSGQGVNVQVTYYPIHQEMRLRQPASVGPLLLRPL